jgi:hypothetical protein
MTLFPLPGGLKAEFDGRSYCPKWVNEEIKSWHRTNITRVADLLAIRPRDEPGAADHLVTRA